MRSKPRNCLKLHCGEAVICLLSYGKREEAGTHQTCRKVWPELTGKKKSARNSGRSTVIFTAQQIQPQKRLISSVELKKM